jgi:hypothetical protein
MSSDQPTYQVSVDQYLVERNDLRMIERLAALTIGKWPKVWLHSIECPCCGKVTFHRAVHKKGLKRRK